MWDKEETLRRIHDAKTSQPVDATAHEEAPASEENPDVIAARMFRRSADCVTPGDEATDIADIGARIYSRPVRRDRMNRSRAMFDPTN